MRKFITRFMVLAIGAYVIFCLTVMYQATRETIEEKHKREVAQMVVIYKNLILNAGTMRIPTLKMSDSSSINAWTDGTSVYMTYPMLDFINGDEDMLALLLAHELSHAIMGHPFMPPEFIDSRQKEAQADKMGVFIMLKSGYDVCEGRKLMLNFMKEFGDDAETTSHPDFGYRLYQMDMPWCSALKG